MAKSNHLNAFMLILGQSWLIQKFNYSKRCHLSSSTDHELNEFVNILLILLTVIQNPT